MNDFFANLFELWGLNMSVPADALYENNIYATVGLVMLVSALACFALFYYVVDSPRYVKPRFWILLMIFMGLGVATFAILHTYNKFNYLGLEYVFGDYLQFTFTVLFMTMLVFFLFSLLGKHWSTNLKDSPFRTRR